MGAGTEAPGQLLLYPAPAFYFPGILGAHLAEEDSNTCGMNNLSVGEAFSLVTLISSHLLPLNIILPKLPALFIYYFLFPPLAVGCSLPPGWGWRQ